jgi:hypothetical protein
MPLNHFAPLTTAKALSLQAIVLVLLTLLIKARMCIMAFSALGIFLLLLQTRVFLAAAGALSLVAGAAGFYRFHPRRTSMA